MWEQDIREHLETAHIILLLISPSFVASEYCFDKELRQALTRHEQGTARVVPIIIRPTYWRDLPFSKLQALPKNALPVLNWQNKDNAFVDVTDGVYKIVQELTGNTNTNSSFLDAQEQAAREVQAASKSGEGYVTHTTTNNSNMTFNAPVSGGAFGPVGRDYVNEQHIHMGTQKDGIRSLEKGSKALWDGNYQTANEELGIAIDDLKEKNRHREAAQACYFLALALLRGELPRTKGATIMRSIEAQMNDAISLNPSCASYYRILACIKRDVFEHIKVLRRSDEDMRLLESKGASLPRCADDDKNEEYFHHCQPRLLL